MPSSATHQVLYISEILRHIFKFLHVHDYSANALVCKQWSEEALSALWRVIEDPFVLFGLLAPLTVVDNGDWDSYRFARDIEPNGWARFDYYAWRVQAIKFDVPRRLDISALRVISATRIQPYILPNLRLLECTIDPEVLSLLVSDRIESISFLDDQDRFLDDPETLMKTLPILSRAPFLEILSLSSLDMGDCESTLLSVLPKLAFLKEVELPLDGLSPDITEALAELRAIEKIYAMDEEVLDYYQPEATFSTALSSNSFPALKDLTMAIRFRRAAICFSRNYSPSTLTTLWLHSTISELPDDYGHLLLLISNTCSQLRELTLWADFEPFPIDDNRVINLATLEPILFCTTLRSLSLHYSHPFTLDTNDLVSIVKALPRLVSLSLNPHPPIRLTPTLDITSLSTVAPLCDGLESLALYLESPELPLFLNIDDESPVNKFKNLRKLTVGSPDFSGYFAPAYFKRVLPAGCLVSGS